MRTVADDLSSQSKGADTQIVEAYVHGELPPEEVTWLARPPAAEAAASLLGFDKYLIAWRWRPPAWPVWNHEIVGPVRLWSMKSGDDEANLSALSDRRGEQLERSSPPDEETFVRRLLIERGAGRKHHKSVLDMYHDRDWRMGHKGFGQLLGEKQRSQWP